MSVTQSLLSIALDHAEKAHARRITDLYLVIGDLTSFVDDSIQFFWGMLTEGTIAEGSTLHFKRIPARLRCLDCELEYTPGRGELLCPQCGGSKVKIVGGDDFRLEAIDIEGDEGK